MFVVITVPAFVVLGLVAGTRAEQPAALERGVFRPLFFAFSMVSVSAVTLVWRVVLLPGRGLANFVGRVFGAMPVDLAHSAALAVPAIALVTVWWLVGVPMMLFPAALQQVPADVYEAAMLDDAQPPAHASCSSRCRRCGARYCSSAMVEIVLQMQVFGQALLIGGDGAAAQSLVQFMYDAAFRDQQFGVAAAASQVLFALVAVAALLQMWLSRRGARACKVRALGAVLDRLIDRGAGRARGAVDRADRLDDRAVVQAERGAGAEHGRHRLVPPFTLRNYADVLAAMPVPAGCCTARSSRSGRRC